MKIEKVQNLNTNQKSQIFDIGNQEYPINLKYNSLEDFEIYLSKLQEQNHYLLTDGAVISGWAFTFLRDHETWFAIILKGEMQGLGFGSAMFEELKKNTETLNGWAIDHNNYIRRNGIVYLSPINFYLKNNFNVITESRLEL